LRRSGEIAGVLSVSILLRRAAAALPAGNRCPGGHDRWQGVSRGPPRLGPPQGGPPQAARHGWVTL